MSIPLILTIAILAILFVLWLIYEVQNPLHVDDFYNPIPKPEKKKEITTAKPAKP